MLRAKLRTDAGKHPESHPDMQSTAPSLPRTDPGDRARSLPAVASVGALLSEGGAPCAPLTPFHVRVPVGPSLNRHQMTSEAVRDSFERGEWDGLLVRVVVVDGLRTHPDVHHEHREEWVVGRVTSPRWTGDAVEAVVVWRDCPAARRLHALLADRLRPGGWSRVGAPRAPGVSLVSSALRSELSRVLPDRWPEFRDSIVARMHDEFGDPDRGGAPSEDDADFECSIVVPHFLDVVDRPAVLGARFLRPLDPQESPR